MADENGPPELLDLLPGELRAIGAIIGVEAALALVEKWPGVPVYVPQKCGPDHPLVRAIGPTAARKLCQAYAGEDIVMPVAAAWRRAMRNALITDGRHSQRTLALAHRLTVRQIANIQRAAREEDERQERLFG